MYLRSLSRVLPNIGKHPVIAMVMHRSWSVARRHSSGMSKKRCLNIVPLVPGLGTTRQFRGGGGEADVLCYCQIHCAVVRSGFPCKAKESKKVERADDRSEEHTSELQSP